MQHLRYRLFPHHLFASRHLASEAVTSPGEGCPAPKQPVRRGAKKAGDESSCMHCLYREPAPLSSTGHHGPTPRKQQRWQFIGEAATFCHHADATLSCCKAEGGHLAGHRQLHRKGRAGIGEAEQKGNSLMESRGGSGLVFIFNRGQL